MIRIFDILISLIGLIILFPFLLLIILLIRVESKGKGIYSQQRVGRKGKKFILYKFRTMQMGSDRINLITVGNRDSRITKIGYILRKYKIDEIPQLYNVLIGDMSIVGPRPEVNKYVELYTESQKIVLSVKPGITDYASIEYLNENEILSMAEDPDKAYINIILPDKISFNLKYINNQSLKEYFKIIFLTILKIFSKM